MKLSPRAEFLPSDILMSVSVAGIPDPFCDFLLIHSVTRATGSLLPSAFIKSDLIGDVMKAQCNHIRTLLSSFCKSCVTFPSLIHQLLNTMFLLLLRHNVAVFVL